MSSSNEYAPVSRLAPTPSGYLHLGNAFNFILTWLLVRKDSGTLWLRIDDLDSERRRKNYVEDIFFSLDWLGLDWEKGPSGPEDFFQNWSQNLRRDNYQDLLSRLAKIPGQVYACQASRKEIKKRRAGGEWPGTDRNRNLSLDVPDATWRIKMSSSQFLGWKDEWLGEVEVNLSQEMPDFVLRKKDEKAAYQVASLADDLKFGVNLLVRGTDLLASTAAQRHLAEILEAEPFLKAATVHHPLLLDKKNHKLSKSKGETALFQLRDKGLKPDFIFQWVARCLGLEADIPDAQTLLRVFTESQPVSRPERLPSPQLPA